MRGILIALIVLASAGLASAQTITYADWRDISEAYNSYARSSGLDQVSMLTRTQYEDFSRLLPAKYRVRVASALREAVGLRVTCEPEQTRVRLTNTGAQMMYLDGVSRSTGTVTYPLYQSTLAREQKVAERFDLDQLCVADELAPGSSTSCTLPTGSWKFSYQSKDSGRIIDYGTRTISCGRGY